MIDILFNINENMHISIVKFSYDGETEILWNMHSFLY